jgi:hypothetical protein
VNSSTDSGPWPELPIDPAPPGSPVSNSNGDARQPGADAAVGPIAAAVEMTGALRALKDELQQAREASEARDRDLQTRDQQLAAYGLETRRRNRVTRRLAVASIIGWVLDIALTVALIVVGLQAYTAGTAAARAQKDGLVTVEKICTRLTTLKPAPAAGKPGNNPSRAYLDYLQNQLVGLGGDLGCRTILKQVTSRHAAGTQP